MNIMITSRNPAKIAAAEEAFRQVFADRDPSAELSFHPVSVPSGVADQPLSDEETRRGAHQRIDAARKAQPDADFWVGMEGGLERIDGRWAASAWMVVCDHSGRRGEARTPTLPLPPGVQQLLDQGLELGEANDRVFATHNSKQAGGAFGLLTEGRLTRGGIYAQSLLLALLPLTHALWDGEG